MAITVVNSSSAVGAGAATTISSPATSLSAGNLLVVGIRLGTNSPAISAVTDTAGNRYIRQNSVVTGASSLQVWYAFNAIANASNVVTATFTSASNRSLCTVQIAGVATSYPLDTWAPSVSGTSATPTTSAFTTLVANEIIVVFGANSASGGTWSAASGYTLQTQDTSHFQGVATQIVSAIQSGVTASIVSTDSTNAKLSYALTFAVSVSAAYTRGTLIVTDADTNDGLGGVQIDSTTGATVATRLPLGAFSNGGTGEGGAQLSDGTMLVPSKDGSVNTYIEIYDASLNELSRTQPFSPTAWNVFSPMASDFTSLFWVSKVHTGSATQVVSLTPAGVVGGTTYTLDDTGTPNVVCMGVSQDNATLYYGLDADGSPIRTWNLTGNTAGGTFIAGSGIVAWGQDLIVIPGTASFIVVAEPAGSAGDTAEVRRYSTIDGSLLITFPLPDGTSNASGVRLSLDLDAPNIAFWVRTYIDITGDTTGFRQISLSSGLVMQSFTIPMNQGGAGGGDLSHVPFSCPFFAWSDNVPSPVTLRPPWPLVPPFAAGVGGLETVAQRRLRVSPHLSSEQFQLFYDQFTLDLQVGNGILTGQGVTPQIMLRMSDDGGYTWSDEILLDSGAQGQYLTRVTANGLGMARDRVFEISTSDPVSWSIIGAYLNTRKGRW